MATHENQSMAWTFFFVPLVPNQWPNAAPVNKEPTDQSEILALMANPVSTVNQVAMVPQAKTRPQMQKCCPHPSNARAKTNPVQLEVKDPKDPPDPLELLVPQVAMVVLVVPVQSDQPDPKVPTANPVPRERTVPMDPQAHQPQDPPDPQAQLVKTVNQAHPVMQEKTAKLVPTARPETMDPVVKLAKLDQKDPKANQVPTDPQDPRGLATSVPQPVWLQDIKPKAHHPHQEIKNANHVAVGLMFTFSLSVGLL